MCGIAGTVFSADFNHGIEVSLNDFNNALQKIENKDGSEALLDLAWQYKSNINFIRFCKKNSERKNLLNYVNLLKSMQIRKGTQFL